MGTTRRFVFALCALAWCSLSVAARPAIRDAINEPGEDWQATFGPELQRGNASAEFALRDAKGHELEVAELRDLQLHRKAGTWWEIAEARFVGSSVRCDGLASLGLDAGSYELELDLGVYGKIQHAFDLKPGEQLKGELKTEVWRRIICLKFVDAKGNALPWLPDVPTHDVVRPANNFSKREVPPRILRDPPSNSSGRGGAGGFAYRRARGGGSKIRTPRYDTDDGRWHVRLFAGASGKLYCPLSDELLGKAELLFEEDFTQAHWDEHPVELAPTEAYAEGTENRKSLNAKDPGSRSLITRAVNPPAPKLDYAEESTIAEGCWRAVIKLDASVEVNANSRALDGNSSITGSSVSRLQRDGNTFWFDLPYHCRAEFVWQSPVVLFSLGRSHTFVRSGRVTIVEHKFDLVPIEIAWPCETAKALTVCVNAWCDRAQNTFPVRRWAKDKPLTLYLERAFLRQQTARSLSLALQHGTANRNLSTVLYGAVTLDEGTLKSVLDGKATVEATWSGLIWRSVNAKGEPLPWVEASLIPSGDVESAIHARRAWMGVRKARLAENAAYTPDFDAEQDDVNTVLKDSSAIDWVDRKGAWYNTHARALAAGAGYNAFSDALKEGERYTLFLWSNSRDELRPDKRIDFVATEGVTDLGVIVLPSYR
jgi:hypothetical protein